MDPWFSLVKKKIKDTEWGIGWLPIGGYVKLSGVMDESMDKEQLKSEPKPWEFRSKPAWQRLIILMGGIIVNILLAWLIFTLTFTFEGKTFLSKEKIDKHGLVFGQTAINAGFKDGDKIIKIDQKETPKNFSHTLLDVLLSEKVTVQRDNQTLDIILEDHHIRDILSSEGRNFMGPKINSIRIDSVTDNSFAKRLGLIKGDQVIKLNEAPIKLSNQLDGALKRFKEKELQLTVKRNGEIQQLSATVNKDDKIFGVFLASEPDLKHLIDSQEYSLAQAIPAGFRESFMHFFYQIKQFKLILRPGTEAYKQISSPIGIASKLPPVWDWGFVWRFTALFSIALAFMNLLPIPGLDGGHAIFAIAEMITGKTLSDKAMENVQKVGMVILLTLMVLVIGKDIVNLVSEYFF